MSVLHIGDFEVERFWKNEYTELPQIKDYQANKIILAMDELLMCFCDSNDLLVTRFPYNYDLYCYLKQIGIGTHSENLFHYDNRMIKDAQFDKTIFQIFQDSCDDIRNKIKDSGIKSISPYATGCDFGTLMDKCGVGSDTISDDKKVLMVNSKEFSANLSMEYVRDYTGKIAYSSEDVKEYVDQFLRNEDTAIIKEPFGVSGKGSMIVDTEKRLKSLTSYIKRQETKGRKTIFIIEKFYKNKSIDFSTHYIIKENGTYEYISMQTMKNNNLSFEGIQTAEKSFEKNILNSNYFQIIEKVISRIYNLGYFGYVCIDSMQLANGTIVPIVEINSRKSLGLMNVYLEKYAKKFNKRSYFTFLNVSLNRKMDFKEILDIFHKNECLFDLKHNCGVIPLSANTLSINSQQLKSEKYKGRLYFSVVFDEINDLSTTVEKMKRALSILGINILN